MAVLVGGDLGQELLAESEPEALALDPLEPQAGLEGRLQGHVLAGLDQQVIREQHGIEATAQRLHRGGDARRRLERRGRERRKRRQNRDHEARSHPL